MAKLKIRERYGVAPNDFLNNAEISLKAKGLYTYIQSKPDDWEFSAERIQQQTKDGLGTIKTTLRELEKAGYLVREKYQGEKGFWHIDYILYCNRKVVEQKPRVKNPPSENPMSENHTNNSKQDSSKKELVNKETNEAGASGIEVNKIIDLFKVVNPMVRSLYGRAPQRNAVKSLLREFGYEKLSQVINYLPISNRDKYAPKITTPCQLVDNLGRLMAWSESKKSGGGEGKVAFS